MTGRDCRVGALVLPMVCPVDGCGCWLQRPPSGPPTVDPHFRMCHPELPTPVVAQ